MAGIDVVALAGSAYHNAAWVLKAVGFLSKIWIEASDNNYQCAIVVLVRFLVKSVYNVWFHPLRKFPGPTLAAATPLPFVWHMVFGILPPWNIKLHAKYGEVVRISPDELSFIGASAWKDIYMVRHFSETLLPSRLRFCNLETFLKGDLLEVLP